MQSDFNDPKIMEIIEAEREDYEANPVLIFTKRIATYRPWEALNSPHQIDSLASC